MRPSASVKQQMQHFLRQNVPWLSLSPFHVPGRDHNRLVLAFEVELSEVCGLDYAWRLCEDGRLVVEARQVAKREFLTLEEAKYFYNTYHRGRARPGVAAGDHLGHGGVTGASAAQHLLAGGAALQPLTGSTVRDCASAVWLSAASPAPAAAAARRAEWPDPLAWTAEAACYRFRTLALSFDDPRVPGALRPLVQGDERLLKLYESGLPAWAVHMPLWGLWYRPWLRRATYALFVCVSIFSMVMGFYDLLKNVPFLHQVLRNVVARMHLPAAAIFQWLDSSLKVRLSILCAYLFGKSALFVALLRWAGHAGALLRAAAQPLALVLGPPLQTVALLVEGVASGAGAAAAAAATGLHGAAAALLGPPGRALVAAARLLHALVLPVFQVLTALLLGPLRLAGALAQSIGEALRVAWGGLRAAAAACAPAWGALRASARLAPALGPGTRTLGEQAAWLAVVPTDMLELLRISALKSFRGCQALVRLFVEVCCSIARHRLTLGLRMTRAWHATKAGAAAAARFPLEFR
ncbi:hypothetical protein WJX81_002181 [Elliptochloris bilobata]|uniref:Uncharacterized protein n=1 Tax=Elliptochloris bilobata TaxID=381761 RepID=A0AAW1QWH9_9CHLO